MYNCVYTCKDFLKSLAYLSTEAEYAEGALDAFRRRLRSHYSAGRVPSSDAFLCRLKKLNRKDALRTIREMNREVLSRAKRMGAFRRKTVAAIDLTFILHYGQPDWHVVQ